MRKKRITHTAGFTMIEIVVSVLIFSLSIAGLLAAISSLNRPAVESFEEVQAAYLAKEIFEELKQGIDAETWGQSGSLLEPKPLTVIKTVVRQGIVFTVSCKIENDITGGRWVDLTIEWN